MIALDQMKPKGSVELKVMDARTKDTLFVRRPNIVVDAGREFILRKITDYNDHDNLTRYAGVLGSMGFGIGGISQTYELGGSWMNTNFSEFRLTANPARNTIAVAQGFDPIENLPTPYHGSTQLYTGYEQIVVEGTGKTETGVSQTSEFYVTGFTGSYSETDFDNAEVNHTLVLPGIDSWRIIDIDFNTTANPYNPGSPTPGIPDWGKITISDPLIDPGLTGVPFRIVLSLRRTNPPSQNPILDPFHPDYIPTQSNVPPLIKNLEFPVPINRSSYPNDEYLKDCDAPLYLSDPATPWVTIFKLKCLLEETDVSYDSTYASAVPISEMGLFLRTTIPGTSTPAPGGDNINSPDNTLRAYAVFSPIPKSDSFIIEATWTVLL